jgi:hypothetical protein
MVFYDIRPDFAPDTQVVVLPTPDTTEFTYRMYPKDTVISGTIVDTIGPAYGIIPAFSLWVDLQNGSAPVSDTVAGPGAFTIRVSTRFPLYRLQWMPYRSYRVPNVSLGLVAQPGDSIAPGTTGIKLTVIKLN